MKRIIWGFLGFFLLASCSNYDLLIKRAIPSYMKKGAKVVSYCDPATEENHFLIFQYGEGLFVNFFDKDRPTTMQFANGASLIMVPNRDKIDFLERFFKWKREETERER